MSIEAARPSEDEREAERLRHIERSRLRALVDADVETAQHLHAPDFQLITPTGRPLSKNEYLGAIAAGHLNYLHWEPEA
ncbi:MAG: nuclear transport factor 2 family protein, partial [Alphaproteobacteria bacterium]|nr:nuclear transport factor 2 family protein [Alphaproteobacteria bacterium]